MHTYSKLSSYRKAVNNVINLREYKERELEVLRDDLAADTELLTDEKEAAELIRAAVKKTQDAFEVNISSIVKYALAGVWDDPYDFSAEFVPRRGRMECDLRFVREGHKIRPMKAGGYGAADVASLALRLAFRNLSNTRPILLMDEPFRQLSEDKQGIAARVSRQLTDELGMQIIMSTHRTKLLEITDKTYEISIHKRVSKCTEVGGEK